MLREPVPALQKSPALEVVASAKAKLPVASDMARADSIPAVHSVAALEEAAAFEAAVTNASGDTMVVMSHSTCPLPPASLVHAMSLKQAAATTLSLAAAAHQADMLAPQPVADMVA